MTQYQYKDSEFKLTIQEVDRLINSTTNFRDKLIVGSLYFPALRRFEVANLDIRDIDFERNRIVIKGKFGKISPIPVGSIYPQYMHDLKLFIGKRNSGYVFLSNQNRKLELSRINQLLDETAQRIGLKNPNPKKKHINPHMLRHSQARHLKDLKFPAEYIQKYLRHKNIGTTMDTYGTLSIEEMESISTERRGFIGIN